MDIEDFFEAYGEVEVKFDTYYKYCFTFLSNPLPDGKIIEVTLGGIGEDIYRLPISSEPRKVHTVRYDAFVSARVYKDKKIVEECYA